MFRLAILDAGTNTFGFYFYELSQEAPPRLLHRSRVMVNLAEAGLGHLSTEVWGRVLAACERFVSLMLRYEVGAYRALGTAALRMADNGAELVALLAQRYHLNLALIEGLEEARLIYQGVGLALGLDHLPSLILDIGGGSIEAIIAEAGTCLWAESFPLGLSRLQHEFQTEGKISRRQAWEILLWLEERFEPLAAACRLYRPQQLIGASGTMDMSYRLYYGRQLNKALDELPLAWFGELWAKVEGTGMTERALAFGLPASKLRLLPEALLLIQAVLRLYPFRRVALSAHALRDGVLLDFCLSQGWRPPSPMA